MKSLAKAMFAAAGMATLAAGAAITGATGDIVPGEWNCDYNKGKAYADANHVPLVVFYGKADCGNCRSLKSHLDSSEAKAWAAEKGYVLVLSTKYSSPGWENARQFCLDAYSVTKLPMISVYWLKENGTVIHKGFTGTSSGMSGTGSMEAKFAYTVDAILGTQGDKPSGGGSDDSGTDPKPSPEAQIPDFFTKARKLGGVVLDKEGDLAGVITVNTGKASKTRKTASVKATVQILGMSKKTFRTTKFNVAETDEFKLTSAFGTLVLKFEGGSFTGTLDSSAGACTVAGATLGGALPSSTGYVTLLDEITQYRGLPVFAQWLPENQTFAAAGTRWTFPKAGKAKYDRTAKTFVNTAETTNPSGMKLSYKSSTGYFKGGFYIYLKKSDVRVTRKKITVVGYVYDGEGYGAATVSGLGTYEVAVTAEPYSAEAGDAAEDGEDVDGTSGE